MNFDTDENTVNDLQNDVRLYDQDFNKIEQQLQSSLQRGLNITFQNLNVETIVINNHYCQEFDSIYGTKLNDMVVDDLLNNILDLEKGFQAEVLTFDTITVQHHFPLNITNWRHFDESKIHDIAVKGSATFHQGLRIDGLLNGIDLNFENVLLKKGNQSFNKLMLNSLDADKMIAKVINDQYISQFKLSNTEPLTYNSFNISNVVLHGFINNVDIPSLNTHALKIYGNQTIRAPLNFESLRVNNVNLKMLSEKRFPEDFFFINEGNYAFQTSTHFTSNFTAQKLYITKQFNNIKVTDGNLEMLMANVDYVQHFTGSITLYELEFINNINLTGPINDILTHDFSPVREINKTLVLNGDYVINSGIKIKEIMRMPDMLSSQPNLSVKRLQEKGLKINDSVVPLHLHFTQQLNVKTKFYCYFT